MILSDREVQLAISRGLFSVTPEPRIEHYDSTTVDLKLDAIISIWGKIEGNAAIGFDPCFCPTANGFNVAEVVKDFTTEHDLVKKGPYKIPPRGVEPGQGFILAWTREKIKIQIPHASVRESRGKVVSPG